MNSLAAKSGIEQVCRSLWARCVSALGGKFAEALLKLPPLGTKFFHCSIEAPFRGLFGAGRAEEITVVSPFYDRNESGEPDDLAFIDDLARSLSPKRINIVLPVQGVRRRLRIRLPLGFVRRWADRLRLYGVDPEEHEGRNLHAKLLAIHHSTGTVRAFFGSANATNAGMSGANVEAGWWTSMGTSEFRQWMNQERLLGKRLDVAQCEFVAPPIAEPHISCPLVSAAAGSDQNSLELTWRTTTMGQGVRLEYEGRRLPVEGDRVQPFRIHRDWYVCVVESRKRHRWYVPIEVTHEVAGLRQYCRYENDPEALLASLTAVPDFEEATAVSRTQRSRATPRGQSKPWLPSCSNGFAG